MSDWCAVALERTADGAAAAVVTLLAVDGSTPREAGTKMLVWPNGQWGTIGGGNLEHQAAAQALRMLKTADDMRLAVQDYPLGPLLGQCCGGRVRLLIERIDNRDRRWLTQAAAFAEAERPYDIFTHLTESAPIKSVAAATGRHGPSLTVNGRPARARDPRPGPGDKIVERLSPARPSLLLFGAGHVGLALARVLEPLPFRLTWCDSRPEAAQTAGVQLMGPQGLADIAREGADYTLILTHDHALDYALVSAALSGGGAAYVGLIGSATKRGRFLSRLRADGFGPDALARIVCPIGVPALKSKAPEIIAVSVAADLLLRLEASHNLADLIEPSTIQETAFAGL